MKGFSKVRVVIASAVILVACSEPSGDKRLIGVAQNPNEQDPAVAESLYCAGAASVLSDFSIDSYPELTQWSSSFENIANNAKASIDSFINEDSETLDNRLVIIKRQTTLKIERLSLKDNKAELKELIETTATQCAKFAS